MQATQNEYMQDNIIKLLEMTMIANIPLIYAEESDGYLIMINMMRVIIIINSFVITVNTFSSFSK